MSVIAEKVIDLPASRIGSLASLPVQVVAQDPSSSMVNVVRGFSFSYIRGTLKQPIFSDSGILVLQYGNGAYSSNSSMVVGAISFLEMINGSNNLSCWAEGQKIVSSAVDSVSSLAPIYLMNIGKEIDVSSCNDTFRLSVLYNSIGVK